MSRLENNYNSIFFYNLELNLDKNPSPKNEKEKSSCRMLTAHVIDGKISDNFRFNNCIIVSN